MNFIVGFICGIAATFLYLNPGEFSALTQSLGAFLNTIVDTAKTVLESSEAESIKNSVSDVVERVTGGSGLDQGSL